MAGRDCLQGTPSGQWKKKTLRVQDARHSSELRPYRPSSQKCGGGILDAEGA